MHTNPITQGAKVALIALGVGVVVVGGAAIAVAATSKSDNKSDNKTPPSGPRQPNVVRVLTDGTMSAQVQTGGSLTLSVESGKLLTVINGAKSVFTVLPNSGSITLLVPEQVAPGDQIQVTWVDANNAQHVGNVMVST
jgi:hypothetical protein